MIEDVVRCTSRDTGGHNLFTDVDGMSNLNDGLVLTDENQPYIPKRDGLFPLVKWKPLELNTVDFLVRLPKPGSHPVIPLELLSTSGGLMDRDSINVSEMLEKEKEIMRRIKSRPFDPNLEDYRWAASMLYSAQDGFCLRFERIKTAQTRTILHSGQSYQRKYQRR